MTSPTLIAEPLPKRLPERSSSMTRLAVPVTLALITLCSTTAVGMRYMHNFRQGLAPLASDADVLPFAWVFANLRSFASGLPFSLTLVGILLAHEFGHYFACRSFGVRSSLPYLLPAPSLSGTFGAVIRLKSKVRSRAALIVIGAAGPIAGFLVAIVTVAFGLVRSTYATHPVLHAVQAPLLISGMHALLCSFVGAPPLANIVPHPMLSASWIGMLITALNLIPAGQLDGGHILYAISPRAHRVSTWLVTAGLLTLGLFAWAGWLLWGALLLLPGMRHPRVPDVREIKGWQYALIPICCVILVFAATFQPVVGFSLIRILHELPSRLH